MTEVEGQQLQTDNQSKRLFDKLCIVLIIFIVFVSVLNWSSLYPNFVDSYYHMAAIRAFTDSGGVVFHDYWEHAPAGRPHVYTPVVHIIGYLLQSLGLGIVAIGQIISWWPYPVSFLAVWLWMRDATGSRSAFFALALLIGPSAWFMNQTAHTSNSVTLVLAPLALLAFSKGKYIIATILSILACYSHGSGFIIPAAFLIYGIHRPKLLVRRVLPVVGATLIAFLPWAIHVYANRNLMSLARMGGDTLTQMGSFQIYPLLMPLAILGLVFAYIRRGKALMLPSLLFAFAVMFPMGYAHRFWRFNSFLPYAVLGGFAINEIVVWLRKRFEWKQLEVVFAVGMVLIGITFDPIIGGHGMPGPGGGPKDRPGQRRPGEELAQRSRLHFQPTAVLQMLGIAPGPGRNQLQDIDIDELVKLIEENTVPEDIIAYGGGPTACMVTALTGRCTNSGMLREVSSEEQSDNLDDVNVLIIQDNSGNNAQMRQRPGGMMNPGGFGGKTRPQERRNNRQRRNRPGMPGPQPLGGPMMGLGQSGMQKPPENFKLIAESDGMSIYRNKGAMTYELLKPDPVLTMPLILLIVAGMAGLMTMDILKSRIKPVVFRIAVPAMCLLCVLACIPMISEGIGELANQPTQPEWLERMPQHMGPGGPGTMMPGASSGKPLRNTGIHSRNRNSSSRSSVGDMTRFPKSGSCTLTKANAPHFTLNLF